MANSKVNISKRAQELPASPIRKLVPLADEVKKKGIKVYHLNIGQPDVPSPKEFFEAVKTYPKEVLEYGHSKGDLRLLKAVSAYFAKNNISVEPEEIMITTGGSEAIIFAMLAVAGAGDEIMVFEPFYTNYNSFAIITGVHLVPLPTKPEEGYHLPAIEKIEEKISPKTKAIFLCNPNNPTGTVFTKKELEGLANLCKKYNLFFLSDEVYREFVYEGEHISLMHLEGLEEQAVLLDSFSKRFSLCGARIGCIVSKNKKIMEVALKLGQARLCSPTLEQHGVLAALKSGDTFFAQIREEFKKRRDVTYAELMKIPGAVCVRPSGAFYIMAKLPVPDIEDFASWMLTDFSLDGETTMIAPGPGFYATSGLGKSEARIAYVLNTSDLKKAMRILAKGIEVYSVQKVKV
ncbi:MAG: hypothetical protein RBG1_1C00001G1045 [candidate division Zixibacteria bacterium RBG-1]|nr:MAG: hypothetical protein RBG1_1C00001G1045 [candidate division Zixibacteria bacterium RBG-1]OGC85707.1 MAG: aspartate aminotransferase [candidate division Zixibacteria bacterium RBG_19FT_COMBO_42_43]